MLNNLFSSFDVKNYMMMNFMTINLLMIMVFYLKNKINLFFIYKKMMMYFLLMNINKSIFFISMFLMIFYLNFFSLNMFMFNLTSQMSFNLMMIMILWTPVMLMNLTKNKNMFLTHILPLGTMNLLIPMLILIELSSFFIRPITLLLRLSINMIAGHVLVNLISNLILNFKMYFFLIMYMYMLMKFLVSFIQAYIVTTLLGLYIEEI